MNGKKVLYHTDGAVRPLLPGIIGCGIDILAMITEVNEHFTQSSPSIS